MSDLVKVLKGEISRIGRKEARSSLAPVRKSTVRLKSAVADINKRLSKLETENAHLMAVVKTLQKQQPAVAPEVAEKARITAKGVRSLRKKLSLTRDDFALLISASPQAVFIWEHKEGPLKLRPQTAAALLSVRDIGAREAKARLAMMAPKKVAPVEKAAKKPVVVEKGKPGPKPKAAKKAKTKK